MEALSLAQMTLLSLTRSLITFSEQPGHVVSSTLVKLRGTLFEIQNRGCRGPHTEKGRSEQGFLPIIHMEAPHTEFLFLSSVGEINWCITRETDAGWK